MKPVSPVIPGTNNQEVIIAEHQEEYQNLPSIITKDGILCRWELEPHEKALLEENGKIYFWQVTFGQEAQPHLFIFNQTFFKEIDYENFVITVGDTEPNPSRLQLTDGFLFTYRLNDWQKISVCESGSIFVFVKTLHQPLQPMLVMVEEPEIQYN